MYKIPGILVAIGVAHLQDVLGLTRHTDIVVNCCLRLPLLYISLSMALQL